MSAGSTGSHRAPRPRIMIVDDAECIRVTIEELFSAEGFDVLAAEGAEQCLEFLHSGFRGVILMDIMMPEKNGWDTIREIEAAGMLKGNIFVMLTGLESPDERMEGLQELVIDYVTKPFVSDDLIALVRRYMSYLGQLDGVDDAV